MFYIIVYIRAMRLGFMKIKKGVEVWGGGGYVINDQKFVGNLGQKGKITCSCFS